MSDPARKQPPWHPSWPGDAPPTGPAELSNEALLELLRDDPARGTPLVYERYAAEVNRSTSRSGFSLATAKRRLRRANKRFSALTARLPELARLARERRSRSLAPSARAGSIGILSRRGNRAGARVIAAEYLKHHPDGPHAAEARSLLDQRSRE